MSQSIGIANLPNQQFRLLARKGATFTLMVVGETGLGKSTFVNTLFATTLLERKDNEPRHQSPVHKTTEIEITRAELEEKGFTLRLNIVDTPGFGESLNNTAAWQSIVDYIDDQHESFLQQDQQPQRGDRIDMRVHACLYFLRPTGNRIRPLDIEAMRALSKRVNVIPVISKADMLAPHDIQRFKEYIRGVLDAHSVLVYRAPQRTGESTESVVDQAPYSVIGADPDSDGRVRGREYPWGVAEVENEDHCDFRKLRNVLIRTHMLDLISATESLHYEAYRSHVLTTRQPGEGRPRPPPDPQFKEEEQALRRAFTEQVNAEVARFNKWEANLIAERDKLNKDLEETYAYIRQLQQQVDQLALRAQ